MSVHKSLAMSLFIVVQDPWYWVDPFFGFHAECPPLNILSMAFLQYLCIDYGLNDWYPTDLEAKVKLMSALPRVLTSDLQ